MSDTACSKVPLHCRRIIATLPIDRGYLVMASAYSWLTCSSIVCGRVHLSTEASVTLS